MRCVEILVGAEKARPDAFGIGFGTLDVGIGVGLGTVRNRVRLSGIGIGRRGGGGVWTRMVGFGRVGISIMNCVDSHVYRVGSVIKIDWVGFKSQFDVFYKLNVEVEYVDGFLV